MLVHLTIAGTGRAFCKVASLMGDSLFWQPAALSFFVARCITVFVLFCGK